jgi:2-keto-4-pentenoate hydratase/2-oxohepta-3-ene-1,7-dioic acid hydratase in catechol pathway
MGRPHQPSRLRALFQGVSMKLVTFEQKGRPARPGLIANGGLVDLSAEGFRDTIAFMAAQPSVQADVAHSKATISLDDVQLKAPILAPPRIFGIGLNYAEHARETKHETQKSPTVFMVLSSAVTGPGEPVILPKASRKVDYEAELAVVISRPGYQVPAAEAMDYVFGYSIMNDVSARDVQKETTQWSLSKSFPTFAPLGPWVVSKDEVPDPHALGISLSIGNEKLQDSNTSELIFKIPELIEYIARVTPLQVGDVISTGTPSGVGMARNPRRWLVPGEEMVIRIDRVGELRNPVVAEK